jgi:hypothetical protein
MHVCVHVLDKPGHLGNDCARQPAVVAVSPHTQAGLPSVPFQFSVPAAESPDTAQSEDLGDSAPEKQPAEAPEKHPAKGPQKVRWR